MKQVISKRGFTLWRLENRWAWVPAGMEPTKKMFESTYGYDSRKASEAFWK